MRLNKGQTSGPVHSSFGWHLIELLDSRQVDRTDAAQKDRAYRMLMNRKFSEEAATWMQEQRASAYVKIPEQLISMPETRKVVITPGEPAGIGPDLVVQLAQRDWPAELVICADGALLTDRAKRLGLPLSLLPYDPAQPPVPQRAGTLTLLNVPLNVPAEPGVLNVQNGAYVVETLARACDGCLSGEFAALVTGPVHKGNINDAGIAFYRSYRGSLKSAREGQQSGDDVGDRGAAGGAGHHPSAVESHQRSDYPRATARDHHHSRSRPAHEIWHCPAACAGLRA